MPSASVTSLWRIPGLVAPAQRTRLWPTQQRPRVPGSGVRLCAGKGSGMPHRGEVVDDRALASPSDVAMVGSRSAVALGAQRPRTPAWTTPCSLGPIDFPLGLADPAVVIHDSRMGTVSMPARTVAPNEASDGPSAETVGRAVCAGTLMAVSAFRPQPPDSPRESPRSWHLRNWSAQAAQRCPSAEPPGPPDSMPQRPCAWVRNRT